MKIHKLYVKQIQPMECAEINGKETLKLIEVVLEEDFFFVFLLFVQISKCRKNYGKDLKEHDKLRAKLWNF